MAMTKLRAAGQREYERSGKRRLTHKSSQFRVRTLQLFGDRPFGVSRRQRYRIDAATAVFRLSQGGKMPPSNRQDCRPCFQAPQTSHHRLGGGYLGMDVLAQARDRQVGLTRRRANSAARSRGTLCHKCYGCPTLQADRKARTSQGLRQAAANLLEDHFAEGNSSHGPCSQVRPRCQRGHDRVQYFAITCPRLACLKSLLCPRVFLWTRGASTSLLGAGGEDWKRASSSPRRTGRCQSICRLAKPRAMARTTRLSMAGPLTSDPVTLHMDCAGEGVAIRAPRKKTLGSRGERADIWSRMSRRSRLRGT